MTATKTKRCGRCGTTDQARFWPSRPTRCKDCVQAYQRDWIKSDKARESWIRKNLAKYGLTLEDYNEILQRQDGHCATCDRTSEENEGRGKARGKSIMLAVDHNHVTGEVRGLLCWWCNLALGYLQDDPDRAVRMADYLRGGERLE